MTIVFVVLTFSTSSGSIQMSCNERFKGIALMFKGEVEPTGITRTFMSYFFLCSSQDVCRVISRKQSKLSIPKTNTIEDWRLWWKLRRMREKYEEQVGIWTTWSMSIDYQGNRVWMPCGDGTSALPTPALSQLQPQLLGTTMARTLGWHYSDTPQFATQPANAALCSFTTAGRKRNLAAVWACREMHQPEKISWIAAGIFCLEKKFPFCFRISRKFPSCFQMQPILHGNTYNRGRCISRRTPCFPEQQLCFPGIRCRVWWVCETKFISFSH